MDKIGQECLEDVKIEKKALGYNVVHITRVTGYMSYTKGWNAGKRAELIDRHRSTLDGEPLSRSK